MTKHLFACDGQTGLRTQHPLRGKDASKNNRSALEEGWYLCSEDFYHCLEFCLAASAFLMAIKGGTKLYFLDTPAPSDEMAKDI